MTGIDLTTGLSINAAKHADIRRGVYADIAAALEIPREYRPLGLTVYIQGVDGVEEYWWKAGTLDADLVKKNPDDAATTVTFSESGVLDLSTLKDYNIFYINCMVNNMSISKINAPHAKEFLLIFISPSGTEYNITIKHVAGNINCGGIDNEFITNASNWWLGKKTHNTTEVWQRTSNSTKDVIPDGDDPNLNGEVIFVEYLPSSGLENVLYVVTSVTPHIAFRWTGTTFIKVGNYDSHLRYLEVKGVITTTISNLTTRSRTLNGYVLQINDRVLYANQANATRNGIFVVTGINELDETVTLERLSLSVSQYKTTLVKVIQGNSMKYSLWMFDMRSSVNLSYNSYLDLGFEETGGINLPTKCIYNPEDIPITVTGNPKAILYINSEGGLVATTAPNANSVLVVKNGNPEWIQGVQGKDLYVGANGIEFANPRPYPITLLDTSTFTPVGSIPQVVYVKIIDANSHGVYTITCDASRDNAVIAFSTIVANSAGYIKTFRFKASSTAGVRPMIAGFIPSLTLDNIQTGTDTIKWIDGQPPLSLEANEELIVYMSIYGITNADVICSWAIISVFEPSPS